MQQQTHEGEYGILGGLGEVGGAIAKFYKNPRIKDLNRDDGLKGVDILHICIPFIDNFVEVVRKEIAEDKPKLTILHSTVAPGTTKAIGGMVVHSPIRGVHPDLYKGIKTFVKYIGADRVEPAHLARDHYEDLGIKCKIYYPSQTTELGKLLSTTYYGLCIAYHGEMKKVCDKFGVNFEQAVTAFNKTYNAGWKEMGRDNVVRPVLSPPEEGIGGHCIMQNTEILKEFMDSEALDLVLKYKMKDEKIS